MRNCKQCRQPYMQPVSGGIVYNHRKEQVYQVDYKCRLCANEVTTYRKVEYKEGEMQ